MLNRKQQETLYNEILKVFDLTEEIVNVLESKDEEDVEVKTAIVQPFIEQTSDSVEILAENYLVYVQNGMKATPAQVKKVESALRLAYNEIRNFIDKLDKLPSASDKKAQMVKDKILESQILPEVGEEPGQLIHGKIYHTLQGLIKKLPHYERLIRAVRNVGIHLWRVVYLFVRLKDGLIQNPENVVWGRAMSDMKQKALLEKSKTEEKRTRDLTKSESHIEIANRAKDGILFSH